MSIFGLGTDVLMDLLFFKGFQIAHLSSVNLDFTVLCALKGGQLRVILLLTVLAQVSGTCLIQLGLLVSGAL